ncbi:TPA: hypothetical protein ACWXDE_005001, partial [Klebsiella pneumoniae]
NGLAVWSKVVLVSVFSDIFLSFNGILHIGSDTFGLGIHESVDERGNRCPSTAAFLHNCVHR